MSIREAMFVLLLPAAWAACALLVGWLSERRSAALAGAAVFGGYLIAHVGLFGWPTMPPTPARHGVAWAGIVGVIGGALIGALRGTGWRAWTVRVVCVVIGLALVGWKRLTFEREWSAPEVAAWSAIVVGAAFMWGLIDSLSSAHRRVGQAVSADAGARWRSADAWLVTAAVAGLGAPFVVFVGAAVSEGEALGALSIALLMGAAFALCTGRVELSFIGAGAATTVTSTLLASTVMWASLPWWTAVGLCLAPAAGLVADVPIMRGRSARTRTIVRVAAVSAAVIAMAVPVLMVVLLFHGMEWPDD